MYLTPLNRILKIGSKGKCCVIYILPTHTKKSIAVPGHHFLMPERYQPHLQHSVTEGALNHTGLDSQSNIAGGDLGGHLV